MCIRDSIYPVDIARIEALSGPQSTLFGASSQTGTVRVVTNKPDMEGTEITGNMAIGVSGVSKGENGFDFDATANIPIIATTTSSSIKVKPLFFMIQRYQIMNHESKI